MKYMLMLLVFTLTGCGGVNYKTQLKTSEVLVKWEIVEDTVATCSAKMGRHVNALACATWKLDHSVCTIYTDAVTEHTIVGHELRHCFEGHFHQ